MKKNWILAAGALAVALVVLIGYSTLNVNPRTLKVGDTAPNFKLPGLTGGEGELKDLRGNVVLLNFWATWCAPCVHELPTMRDLQQRYAGKEFQVVAVALDIEGASVVRPFGETNKLNFNVVVDTKGVTQDLYQLSGLPESYILDRNGIIRHKISGGRDWTDPRNIELIASLVGSQPRPAPPREATGGLTGNPDQLLQGLMGGGR